MAADERPARSHQCRCRHQLAVVASSPLHNYLPVLILVAMAATFGIFNVGASLVLGPKRTGKVKEITYESGMNPVGTAHKRFNVRFYIIAMIFWCSTSGSSTLPLAITFPTSISPRARRSCGSGASCSSCSRRSSRTYTGVRRASSDSTGSPASGALHHEVSWLDSPRPALCRRPAARSTDSPDRIARFAVFGRRNTDRSTVFHVRPALATSDDAASSISTRSSRIRPRSSNVEDWPATTRFHARNLSQQHRLRAARALIATRDLSIVFQPIVDMEDGRIYAYEALMPGREPGFQSPAQLFQSAERCGLLWSSRRSREAAFQAAVGWPAGTQLFLNSSPAVFADDRFIGASATASAGHRA